MNLGRILRSIRKNGFALIPVALFFLALYEGQAKGSVICVVLGTIVLYGGLMSMVEYEKGRSAERKLARISAVIRFGDEAVSEKLAKIKAIDDEF